MIIKCLSRKSGTANIIKYLFKEEQKLVRGDSQPCIIRHNMRGRKVESWINEFDANEKLRVYRRKDSTKSYHTILSFSNKDNKHITKAVLQDIAKQYIKFRGVNCQFIGAAHRDREHIHLHLVQSAVKYRTGESARISKADFHKLKIAMSNYQQEKYPELINSLPQHGRSRTQERGQKESHIPVPDKRASQKESLLKSLQMAYKKADSLEAFLSDMKAQGYTPYYRASKLTGIQLPNGRKFRLLRLGYNPDRLADFFTVRAGEKKDLDDLRRIRTRSRERGRDRGRERSLDEEIFGSRKHNEESEDY